MNAKKEPQSQRRKPCLGVIGVLLFFPVWFFMSVCLFPQVKKVIVTTEKADIYAEPYARSYLIENVKRGTVLDLFQMSKVNDTWYYVRFQSRRYGGPVMGFIKDSQVEPLSGDTPPLSKSQDKQAAPLPPPPPVQKTIPKKSELAAELKPPIKEATAEEEPKTPVTKIEESPVDTAMLSHTDIFLSSPADALDSVIWLTTRMEFAATPIPLAGSMQTQAAPSQLQGQSWQIQAPAPKPVVPVKAETPPPERNRETRDSGPPSPVMLSEKIQLAQEADSFYIQLGYAGFSSFRSFELKDPNRIVIDLYDLPESAGFERHQINDRGIDNIRVGMFQSDIARVVFDFTQEILPYRIDQTETGLKIQFRFSEPAGSPSGETLMDTEPEIHIEKTLHATKIPSAAVPFLKEYQAPENERLFLEISGQAIETALPIRYPPDLSIFHIPLEETFWEEVHVQAVQEAARPQAKRLDLPVPEAALPEKIQLEKTQPETKQPEPRVEKETKKPPEKEPEQFPYMQPKPSGPSLFTLGFGYGASKGGMGGHVQYNLSHSLAVHAGVGYYPAALIYSETDWVDNTVLYSAGFKYYFPLSTERIRPYLNLQYGGFTVEAVQIIEGIWEYEFIYRNEQKALFGPQALIGGEIRLGRFGFNAAAGVAYALTNWEWLPQDLYFTFDIGLLFYLK